MSNLKPSIIYTKFNTQNSIAFQKKIILNVKF